MSKTEAFVGRLPDQRFAAVSLGEIKFCILGESVEEVTASANRAVAFARQSPKWEVVSLEYVSELMLEAA